MPVHVTYRLGAAAAGRSVRRFMETLDRTTLHAEIGEQLLLSTDERWVREVAPDGTPWAPLSPATIESGAKRQRRGRLRPGDVAAYSVHKRILQELGTRGGLRGSIVYEAGNDDVRIGSNKVYARAHQRGLGERSNVASRRRFGALPARPFVGVSDDDELAIADVIRDWLGKRVR